jgi:hypothetical protein
MKVVEERVDINKVSYLLEHYTYEAFLTNFDGIQKDAKVMYNKIVKYLNSKINGEKLVRYNYIKGRTDGRLFGEANSIQGLPKNIRGFICDGITTDIDMINAHPTILKKLCEEHDIQCPNLCLYINERKKYLNKIAQDDNISYELAKRKILIATNSNRKINSNNGFFKNYSKEMTIIQKAFIGLSHYDYIKEYAKKDNNFEGSFINHILCIHEDIILQSIIDWVETYDISIHSIMFDGLMVYGTITEPTLIDIEQHIAKLTIFDNIKLSIKQHETTFVLPEDYKPAKLITYEDIKESFEKINCKVDDRFVKELNGEIKIYSRSCYLALYEDLIYKETLGGKTKKFINTWLEDPDKRRYDDFGNFPKESMCPKNCYNMWKPFPVKVITEYKNEEMCKKALNYYLKHIKVLCNHDEKVFEFVCMWIAQMFQYPEHKSIEIIFISEEGVGKGLLLEFFKTIMGGSKRCWETTSPEKEVFGHFNGAMKDAFLVCFNEVNKSNFYNVNDKKKAIITDNNININIKGVPEFNIASYHRFIAFTNNPEPATKNARRDIFIRCSNEKVGHTEYFTEGFNYATNLECCAYIYNYFMKLPTKVKINSVDIPKTDYDEIIEEAQENPVVSFIKDFVIDNNTLPEIKIDVDDLYNNYRDYCCANDISLESMNKIKFGVRLHFMKGQNIIKDRKKVNNKVRNIYTFNIPELIKQYSLTD